MCKGRLRSHPCSPRPQRSSASLRWYVRNVSTPGRHVNRRDQKFARGVKILDGGNQDSACGKKDLRDPEHARYSVFLSRTFPGLNTAAALPHGGKGAPPPLGGTQCPGGKNTPEHVASQHRQTIHQQCQTTRAQECRRLTIDEQLYRHRDRKPQGCIRRTFHY